MCARQLRNFGDEESVCGDRRQRTVERESVIDGPLQLRDSHVAVTRGDLANPEQTKQNAQRGVCVSDLRHKHPAPKQAGALVRTHTIPAQIGLNVRRSERSYAFVIERIIIY